MMKRMAGWWENKLKVDTRKAVDTRKTVDIYIHLHYPSRLISTPSSVAKSFLLCSKHYMRRHNIGGGTITIIIRHCISFLGIDVEFASPDMNILPI